MDFFKEINGEGTAIVLLTHDARVAAQSQRVLFMAGGRLVGELKLSENEDDFGTRIQKVEKEMRKAGI